MTLSTKSTNKHPQKTTLTHHPHRPAPASHSSQRHHTHRDTSGVAAKNAADFFSDLHIRTHVQIFSRFLSHSRSRLTLSLSLPLPQNAILTRARSHAVFLTCRPPQSTHRLRWRPCSQMLNQNGRINVTTDTDGTCINIR